MSGDFFDPGANARAALGSFRARYEHVREAWQEFTRTRGDEAMAGTTIEAPTNPYRRRELADAGMWGEGIAASSMSVPMRSDTERGPGLTAGDIDRIARDHHHAGYAKAEREMEGKLDEMRAELADAFDRGYTAGRVERAQGLAHDMRHRLMSLHFALLRAEQAKTKVPTLLPAVRAELSDLLGFVTSMELSPETAAAQVARDES